MRYLTSERRLQLVAAALLQTVAIFARAISICAAPFCLYLTWWRYQQPGAAAPLLAVAILIQSLLHFLYPQAPQGRKSILGCLKTFLVVRDHRAKKVGGKHLGRRKIVPCEG